MNRGVVRSSGATAVQASDVVVRKIKSVDVTRKCAHTHTLKHTHTYTHMHLCLLYTSRNAEIHYNVAVEKLKVIFEQYCHAIIVLPV